MRRHDKKIHMERVNKLFEQRNLKESAFSWDGKYANEDIEEGMGLPMDFEPELQEEGEEVIDEEVTNITTDVNSSQFFSDEESDMIKDGPPVG
jgi:hypothetical protein